ncbi:hypothetical protein JCM14076_21030 [Methylosoma difficile]
MKKKTLINAAIAATTLIGATAVFSATYGKEWVYAVSYSSSGVPAGMTNLASQFPTNLVSSILTVLPESRVVSPSLITDDHGANLFLKKDAHIRIAYVTEGAGYRNALGFFQFIPSDLNNAAFVPSTKIMFPDYSSDKLTSGDSVDLGTFSAGTAIGFTVVANGWNGTKVNPSQDLKNIYYTIKGLNPETDANYKPHTVLLSSPQDELLVLGIEDLYRMPGSGSDEDFNDAVIAIFVEPFDAVDRGNITTFDTSTPDTPSTETSETKGFSGRLNWREKADQKTTSTDVNQTR